MRPATDDDQRGGFELGCDLPIRLRRRPCQVPGTLLLARDDLGEPRVDFPASIKWRPVVDRRREQRMGESDALAVHHQHALAGGIRKPGPGSVVTPWRPPATPGSRALRQPHTG